MFSEIREKGLVEVIDRCTMNMYSKFGKIKEYLSAVDMKEIQMVIIRNNQLNQYTTYNYPLLTKVQEHHQE